MSATQPLRGREQEPVVIQVVIRHNRVRVRPNVARVKKNEPIRWDFEMSDSDLVARARIYFEMGSPFSWSQFDVLPGRGGVLGSVQEAPPETGEYKYGVRLMSSQNEVLDDDDPWLIVE